MAFSQTRLLAPCYHIVSDEILPHVRHLYPFRDVRRFTEELDFLLKRFEPVSLTEVTDWAAGRGVLPKNALHHSFDDGFREMHEVVAPLCWQKGVPATFFLTAGFLDNKLLGFRHKASVLLEAFARISQAQALTLVREAARSFDLECNQDVRRFVLSIRYQDSQLLDELARLAGLDFGAYLSSQRPYLTSEQVRELLKDGFSIGAHSLDHPLYSEITLEQQIEQTRGSIEFLEEHFEVKGRAFAFPFVSDGVEDEFYRRIFSVGICDVVFRIGGLPMDQGWPVIERFSVERTTNEPIWTILRGMTRRRWRSRIRQMLAPPGRIMK